MPGPVTPLLAADIVISLVDRPGRPIVLIKRLNPPFGWAIPGGFVDVGETVEQAACREMREEVGLEVTITGLLGVYSRPDRDPRGHTVTVIYTGEATGTPVAADDAAEVGIFTRDDLPSPLAFDHEEVLADYFGSRS
jgi:8-oxo-dGTP diphosphatase